MKKENKVVFIIILILLVAIILCCYILMKKKNVVINGNNDNKTVILTGDKFKLVDNQSLYFSLQNSVNSYYENINNDSYIKKIIIDSKETFDDFESLSYVMNKAYYYEINDSVIYFVSGYMIKQSYVEEVNQYLENVSYFIYEKNDTIRLKRIDTDNLEIYLSKLYYKGSINIKDGVNFNVQNVSDENKLSFYLSNFINLLINKPKHAYGYLDDNMKKYYDKYSVFSNKINDFYNKMTPVIFSYTVNDVGGDKVYRIVDDNQNNVVITEKVIMDYKIFIDIY